MHRRGKAQRVEDHGAEREGGAAAREDARSHEARRDEEVGGAAEDPCCCCCGLIIWNSVVWEQLQKGKRICSFTALNRKNLSRFLLPGLKTPNLTVRTIIHLRFWIGLAKLAGNHHGKNKDVLGY